MISLTLKNYLKIFESHSEFNASLEDFALVFLVFEVSFVASSVIIQSDFLQIFFLREQCTFLLCSLPVSLLPSLERHVQRKKQ